MTDPDALNPGALIAALVLAPHPEGGWYRQTWIADLGFGAQHDAEPHDRPAATAILILLKAGGVSHRQRVDATEIGHFHAGAPLILRIATSDAGPARRLILGPDILAGQSAQAIVPADAWQSARSAGACTQVVCTVSPGFRFDGFTLAAPGFDIPDA